MKPSKLLSLAIVLLTTGWVSLTAAEPITDELQELTPVTVTFSCDPPNNEVKPGQTFDITVNFTIQPGWHIYDSTPGGVGRPATIDLTLPAGFTQDPPRWSPPQTFDDGGFRYSGYEGTATVTITIHAPQQIKRQQAAALVTHVTWLACSNSCIPGEASNTQVLQLGFAPAGGTQTGTSAATPAGNQTGSGAQMGFLAYLAFAFIGGVLLNLMPCVLPVLAFKIMRFVKESKESRSKVFKLGLAYAAGTIATCMSLAAVVIVAQLLGASIGWGFQFQQPLFVLALATLVTVMSLGMFGVFMVQVSVGQNISKLSQNDGYAGAFFTGVLATILSTPCTAPFLGTAVGFAFAESWWVILLIFFTVGLGLAAPYLVLTSNPGWMKYIPKPGAWMEHVKEAMAFSLMGSVIWLLYIIGQQTGSEGLIATLIFLLAASFSSWLVGRFSMFETRKLKKTLVWIAALGVPAALFFWQVLPAFSAKANTPTSGQMFSQESVEKALKNGKIVFVDFTAAWCLTCQVNESGVLRDAEVLKAMEHHDVIVLKADWTNGDPEITKALKSHQRSGVPLYLVYSPHRPNAPVILPEILTKSAVLDALEQACQP
ncbi:MAG: thioredoxin family protein [Candidatus Obscuribacterales bacterium]|nr:thioredoxin family protein [Candidatus Obscuribacterales bacterium]